jgi:hypothetical protein
MSNKKSSYWLTMAPECLEEGLIHEIVHATFEAAAEFGLNNQETLICRLRHR